jgi:hypothetical protein
VTSFRFVRFGGPIRYEEKTLYTRRGIDNPRAPGTPLAPGPDPVVLWEYADGTVFGEVLLLPDRTGKRYCFDLRTRTKVLGDWRMEAYRPVRTRQELESLVDRRLLGNPVVKKYTLSDAHRHPDGKVIERTALVDTLPELPEGTVRKLLARPFRSARNLPWLTDAATGLSGHAPTTKAKFSIVPEDYDGAFIAVNNRSCMGCHDSIMKEAEEFKVNRDWYGRTRGSAVDRIFTFHPFAVESIAPKGAGSANLPRKFRKELIEKGLLQPRVP